jgi:transcriptional regulator with XRE-family HTH domain
MDRFVPIGERIVVYRRRRGLSQTKLAHLVGRSENWLSQIGGRRRASSPTSW